MGPTLDIQNLAKSLRSKIKDRDDILATIDALETSWNTGDREEVKKLSGKLYAVISKDIITEAQRRSLKDMEDGKSKPEKRKKPPTTAEQTNQEGPCDKDEMNRKATKSTEEGGVKESASPDKTAKQSDKEEGNNSQQKETSDKEDAKQDDEVQKPSETDVHEEVKALEEDSVNMKTLETENGTLQAEKEQALKDDLNKTINAKVSDLESLKETIKTKGSKLESLKETNKTKDSELESLKETMKTKDSKLKSLKETIKTNDSELESLKETMKTKDSELESLKETMKTKDSELESLKETIKTNDSELESLKETMKTKDSELESLKETMKTNDSELKSLKETIKIKDCDHEKLTESISYQESEHQTKYKALKERIDHLHSEMNRNNLKLERSETFLQESQERNDELSTRLSKAVGDKLTHNNPNIADLSDGNRPTKLAERYSELYDNEWTDAYEILEKIPNRKVEETVSILRKILLDCYDVCMKTADVQMQHIKSLFLHPPTNGEIGDGKEEFKFSEGQENMLSSLRKETADQSHKALVKVILKKHRETKSDAMKKFIKTCTDLCWKMAIQTPPVFIDTMDRRDDLFDNNMFKAYTSVGKYVDFVVWPPLYLHENGSMLSKGIAQGKKGKGK